MTARGSCRSWEVAAGRAQVRPDRVLAGQDAHRRKRGSKGDRPPASDLEIYSRRHANLAETLQRIAAASHRAVLAHHQQEDEAPKLRETIADCDTKIARYRSTLDAGGDPSLVAGWISETTALRKAALAGLGFTEAPPERMSERQMPR